mmetsp:Transcript_34097/g.66411  ORF Transcript_34097/g.66411 Transcript_34097/m.66411 type:complete len:390 (+) Transcript_34097:2-1171(+)
MDLNLAFRAADDEKDAPLLCTFPGGIDKAVKKNLKFDILEHRDKKKRKRLEARGGRVTYTGKNFGDANKSKNLSKWAMAVFDPVSKEVRMVPIDHIYEMTQSVGNVKDDVKESLQTPEAQQLQRQALVDSFASSKRKRKFNSALKARIKLDSEVGVDALDNAISNLEDKLTAEEDLPDAHEVIRDLLPKHDETTSVVDAIYPVDGLLGKEELSALNPTIIKKGLKRPWLVVQELITKAEAIKDKKPRKLRLRLCLYLHYLLLFQGLPGKGKTRFMDRIEAPPAIASQLLDLFTNEVKFHQRVNRDESRQQQEKLRCRICVVALKASGYELAPGQVQDLAKALKVTIGKMTKYFREVGAKSSRGDGGFKVTLKAPLDLPKMKTGGGGRRR